MLVLVGVGQEELEVVGRKCGSPRQVHHSGDSSLLPSRRWKRLFRCGDSGQAVARGCVCHRRFTDSSSGSGGGSLTRGCVHGPASPGLCTVPFRRQLVASGKALSVHDLAACARV